MGPFRKSKAAAKMQTILDVCGSIPSFIHVSEGKLHNVDVLDRLVPEPGAPYLIDRAYLDARHLDKLHQTGACFVTPARKNFHARSVESAPIPRSASSRTRLWPWTARTARVATSNTCDVIRYRDPVSNQTLVSRPTAPDSPRLRFATCIRAFWKSNPLSGFINGNFRVKRFLGTSKYVVNSQVWSAVSVYVLDVTLLKRLAIDTPLHNMLQFLSIMPFEQVQIYEALTM